VEEWHAADDRREAGGGGAAAAAVPGRDHGSARVARVRAVAEVWRASLSALERASEPAGDEKLFDRRRTAT
jgi:hypothetical protein